jgi:hypothetical protein
VEPQDIPRIRVSGLMENTNKDMLAMYFEHEERNGGGKVKNIEIDQKGMFATIDFEEKAGSCSYFCHKHVFVFWILLTLTIFGYIIITLRKRLEITDILNNL